MVKKEETKPKAKKLTEKERATKVAKAEKEKLAKQKLLEKERAAKKAEKEKLAKQKLLEKEKLAKQKLLEKEKLAKEKEKNKTKKPPVKKTVAKTEKPKKEKQVKNASASTSTKSKTKNNNKVLNCYASTEDIVSSHTLPPETPVININSLSKASQGKKVVGPESSVSAKELLEKANENFSNVMNVNNNDINNDMMETDDQSRLE